MKTFYVLFLSLLSFSLFAQNQVRYETLGISFTVPIGWYGEEAATGYLMSSQTGEGYILIQTHQGKTIGELEAGAREGIVDEASFSQLNLVGSTEKITSTSIGGVFEGIVEWTPAKAYVIGMLNTHGHGVTIIATTAKNNYSDKFKQLAMQVSRSVNFSIPKESEDVKIWAEKLKDCRLTAMYTSTSTSGAYGENASYLSSKTVYDLCGQGYFTYSGTSSASFDTNSGFSHGQSRGNGDGTWKVVGNVAGQTVLQLTYNSGNTVELVITFEDRKTRLDGERFFRTYGEKGPFCN